MVQAVASDEGGAPPGVRDNRGGLDLREELLELVFLLVDKDNSKTLELNEVRAP